MKYTIEPTAVVYDYNYDEAVIYTNKAKLILDVLNQNDGTTVQFQARDMGDGIIFLEVAAPKANEKPYWILTSVPVHKWNAQVFTDEMKHDAVMEIWGRTDFHILAGNPDTCMETIQSLTDIIQDGKACGETDSIESQEALIARLQEAGK